MTTSPDDDFFDLDTASATRGDGVREVVLTDRWNTPLGKPNGGYLLATMLRGLGEEIGRDDALVASISYLRSPDPGPALLRCEVIKSGRRTTTAVATLEQGHRIVGHLVATFGGQSDGRTLELGTPPDLPDPESLPDPRAELTAGSSLFDRVDYRLARRPGWADGAPNGNPSYEMWQRLAGGRLADRPALGLLVDSFAPPVMEIGEMLSMTVQLTVHFHGVATTPWVATRLSTQHVVGGFHEEDCELWSQDGRLLAQSRQLAILG